MGWSSSSSRWASPSCSSRCCCRVRPSKIFVPQGVQPVWLVRPPPASDDSAADHAWTWTLHDALRRT